MQTVISVKVSTDVKLSPNDLYILSLINPNINPDINRYITFLEIELAKMLDPIIPANIHKIGSFMVPIINSKRKFISIKL